MTIGKNFTGVILIGLIFLVHVEGIGKDCSESPLHLAAKSGYVAYIGKAARDDLYAKDCLGLTPMHVAIAQGNVDFMVSLAEADFDVNRLNGDLIPILHYSVTNGTKVTTKVLLSIGSIANAENSIFQTPLYLALKKHNEAVCQLLVSHGADVNESDAVGNTFAHTFVKEKDLRALKLLEVLKGEFDLKNNILETPLSIAVKSNAPSFINFLIAHGANITMLPYLHNALTADAYDSFRALLENGLPTEKESDDGQSIIERAVMDNKIQAIDILATFRRVHRSRSFFSMQTSNSNYRVNDHDDAFQLKDNNGNSVLHVAVKLGKIDLLKEMLSKYKKYKINDFGQGGSTVIELALGNDNADIMEVLASFGAGINPSNTDKPSLLKQAVLAGSRRAIVWLIDHGADPMEKDKEGNTILHDAAKLGSLEILKSILSRTNKLDVNVRGEKNLTPLFTAVLAGQTAIVKELIGHGADIEAVADNCPVLPWSAYNNQTDATLELLSHKVNLDSTCKSGNTALIFSADRNNVKVVKKLLELGANPNIIGEKKRTALIWTTRGGYNIPDRYDIVKALLDKGAQVNIKDDHGHTALYYARKNGSKPITIVLLESKGGVYE